MHEDYPFIIDISIVKSSSKDINTKQYKPVYNIEDSNVFNNRENYEIEIDWNIFCDFHDSDRLRRSQYGEIIF